MKDAVDDLYEEHALFDHDHIVLLDRVEIDRYGRIIFNYESNNKTFHVARSYSGGGYTRVSEYDIKIMTIHEGGHTYQARHRNGNYRRVFSGGDSYPTNMSPMATPYILKEDGTNAHDCFFGGEGTEPSEFCIPPNEDVEIEEQGDCFENYTESISTCTIDVIDAYLNEVKQ